MFSKSSILALLVAATTSLAAPVAESRDTCVILQPGNYTISSAANDWHVVPYHHAMAPPAIVTQQAAPTGNYGVWGISPAPQSAYNMVNVGEGYVVSTLTYGGTPQPYTAYTATQTPFAIQCAGGGTYVIKNPVADEVWTALPGAFIKMIGANGDITQRFKFAKV